MSQINRKNVQEACLRGEMASVLWFFEGKGNKIPYDLVESFLKNDNNADAVASLASQKSGLLYAKSDGRFETVACVCVRMRANKTLHALCRIPKALCNVNSYLGPLALAFEIGRFEQARFLIAQGVPTSSVHPCRIYGIPMEFFCYRNAFKRCRRAAIALLKLKAARWDRFLIRHLAMLVWHSRGLDAWVDPVDWQDAQDYRRHCEQVAISERAASDCKDRLRAIK